MKITKLLALLLALVMVLSCLAGCKPAKEPDNTEGSKPAEEGVATYTYRDYITQPATVWNPLNYKTAQDSAILQYLVTPLVTKSVKDTEKGEFQWVYKGATAITDVTKSSKTDLAKYSVTAQADEGHVFEIKLNADMKWQDGTAITADTYVESMKALLDPAAKNSQASLYCTGAAAIAGANSYYTGSKEGYDQTVGFYKVDDTTIRYVCQSQIDLNDFMSFCSNIRLVNKDLYEKGKDTYGTSVDTTMSYGPYKLSSQDDKQFVLEQNENYFEYEKKEDGTLYAETDYTVDGENVQAYQTTKIIIDVMTDAAAEEAFLKGELSRWTPGADKIGDYLESSQLRKEAKAETYAFFFNTNATTLKKLDSKGDKNAAVVSNINFRQAFSRAMDRKDFVTATAGLEPAWYLLNEQFYYDAYKDAESVYRDSNQAMQAIVDLYGLYYIDGAEFETLEAAYGSIAAKAGFYPEDAKELMLKACTELVSANLYQKGNPIEIRVAYAGEFGDAEKAQLDKVNAYLNTAAAGSGFGQITLVGAGNVDSSKVADGEYAIGYGAKGGDVYAAFTNMQLYYDADLNAVDELGCWNPAKEEMTVEITGKKVTKTLKEWSHCLVGEGEYASAPIGIKLDIAAAMELALLSKYYRIPMAADCNTYLQSYQVRDFAEEYNAMYGFGGFELMSYDYTDAQWAEYVSKSNGELSYE